MKKTTIMLFTCAALVFVGCKKEDKIVDTKAPEPVVEQSLDGDKYEVQTAASIIDWQGGKMVGDPHTGTLALDYGEIYVQGGKITIGKFVVDMTSLQVTDLTDPEKKAMLEAHLKGTAAEKEDHFFNTKKYPKATFEITNIVDENDQQMIEGNLMIKDIEHNIKFPATVVVDGEKVEITSDYFGIDRTKWGVNYNSGTVMKDLAGDKVINDEIKVKLHIIAKK